MKTKEAKYLLVTIHDNDFGYFTLEYIGEILQEYFKYCSYYPKKEDLPYLKKYIQNVWFGVSNIENFLLYRVRNTEKRCERYFDWFEPDLKIVDFSEIEDNADGENVYVPLFEGGEIILR